MISRKKKWQGDQGLLELRARAVYIINEKKMVKSRRWKDLSLVIDPGDFVLLNSPTSDRREILKVAPPIIQSHWASILLPLEQANDICTNQPAASQWHYCTCSYRGELGCS